MRLWAKPALDHARALFRTAPLHLCASVLIHSAKWQMSNQRQKDQESRRPRSAEPVLIQPQVATEFLEFSVIVVTGCMDVFRFGYESDFRV